MLWWFTWSNGIIVENSSDAWRTLRMLRMPCRVGTVSKSGVFRGYALDNCSLRDNLVVVGQKNSIFSNKHNRIELIWCHRVTLLNAENVNFVLNRIRNTNPRKIVPIGCRSIYFSLSAMKLKISIFLTWKSNKSRFWASPTYPVPNVSYETASVRLVAENLFSPINMRCVQQVCRTA